MGAPAHRHDVGCALALMVAMIRSLSLLDFKSFAIESTEFGPFTVVIGANASGKSNLRDALRFLHGLSRGYTLAETIGEKWVEGGVLQWQGIRGGAREAARHGSPSFTLATILEVEDQGRLRTAAYTVGVRVDGATPRIMFERFRAPGYNRPFFDTYPDDSPAGGDADHIHARVRQTDKRGRDPSRTFLSDRPILTQLAGRDDIQKTVRDMAAAAIAALGSMRFLDLSPDAMRRPSQPGQKILSDRGENLASVLQLIYQDEATREPMLEWIRELTPMDVRDLTFDTDTTGRVVLSLVEADGNRTSVYSASDGTLRLLAMIAAFLGPATARFYFLEELEVGIHPARLYVLLDLIEQQSRRTGRPPVQVVATTHSPHLLRQLRPETLDHALLVYRDGGAGTSRLVPIHDVPGIDAAALSDPGRLHESAWFENVLAFSGDGAANEPAVLGE